MYRLHRFIGGPLLLTYLCACGTDVVGLPRGAIPWTPPAQFRAWWQLTEACSGLTGDYDAVKWYVVPNADSFSLEGQDVNAAWYGGGNRIALGDSETTDGSLVRHEMLHALMQSGAHPRDRFLERCGDIVVCVDRCVSDAGGSPDTASNAAIVDDTAFTPSTLVVPNPASVTATGGWVTITVALTNTLAERARLAVQTYKGMPISEVLIRITPTTPSATNGSFHGDQFDSYFAFAPVGTAGATRRVVFDVQLFPVGDSSESFRVSDAFGNAIGPTVLLTVVQ